jgi:hypothetical protein
LPASAGAAFAKSATSAPALTSLVPTAGVIL